MNIEEMVERKAHSVNIRNMEVSPDGLEIRLYLNVPTGVSAPMGESEAKALVRGIVEGVSYQGRDVEWWPQGRPHISQACRPDTILGTLVYDTDKGAKAACSLTKAAADHLTERIDWFVWCLLADHREGMGFGSTHNPDAKP